MCTSLQSFSWLSSNQSVGSCTRPCTWTYQKASTNIQSTHSPSQCLLITFQLLMDHIDRDQARVTEGKRHFMVGGQLPTVSGQEGNMSAHIVCSPLHCRTRWFNPIVQLSTVWKVCIPPSYNHMHHTNRSRGIIYRLLNQHCTMIQLRIIVWIET